MKGDGGIIGIAENEAPVTQWTVSGLETARLPMEYVENHSLKRKATDNHHEQIPSHSVTRAVSPCRHERALCYPVDLGQLAGQNPTGLSVAYY